MVVPEKCSTERQFKKGGGLLFYICLSPKNKLVRRCRPEVKNHFLSKSGTFFAISLFTPNAALKSIKAYSTDRSLSSSALRICTHAARAQNNRCRVVARGLLRPTGIDVREHSAFFFTAGPTPGISGAKGGKNSIKRLNLRRGRMSEPHSGEPESVNISVGPEASLSAWC